MGRLFNQAKIGALALSTALIMAGTAHAGSIVILDGRTTAVTAQLEDFALSNGVFTFLIRNTSVSPGITGDITNIGFDLPNLNAPGSDGADRGPFTLVFQSNANYALENDDKANATGLNIKHLDFALDRGSNFNGGGKPGNGILPGGTATFAVSGNFSNLTSLNIAESVYTRFQAVNGDGSDVAEYGGIVDGAVPEPSSLLLVCASLLGLIWVRLPAWRRKLF